MNYVLNHVTVGTSYKEYIAMQGPINQSLDSLWEIAWKTESHTIVSVRKPKHWSCLMLYTGGLEILYNVSKIICFLLKWIKKVLLA